ncbi:MAG: YHS domain protein [Myxococcales bacterium]|nr:YHS domain protein [Myxococcales bacterium]
MPLLASFVSASALAVDPVYSNWRGLAIAGTDPVAYFTEGRAVSGSKTFQLDWKGATWRFSSAENLEAFKADPGRYEPRYGGYCAWAVAQGNTAGIDPQAWKIVEGSLYLNYSRSVQKRWEEDIPGHIAKADENWPRILAED